MRIDSPMAVLLVVFLTAGMAMAAGDKWTIQAEVQGSEMMVLPGGKTGDVPFPHRVHQAAYGDCKPCHELYPQEKGAVAEMKAQGLLKKKAVMKNCQKCHRKIKKAGEKSGPTGCRACHSLKH
jgi:cytochrome c7-like protein